MKREYTFDYTRETEEEIAIKTINMFIDSLVDCRGSTCHPEELEWGIRLYKFMLEKPVERLKAYGEVRKKIFSKRQVAKILGWDVK